MSFSEDAVIKNLIQESKGLAQAAENLANEPESQVAVINAQLSDIAEYGYAVSVITVGSSGRDFTSLRAAVDSITNSSIDNKYIIKLDEGTYDIATYYTSEEMAAIGFIGLIVPDYVTIEGQGEREGTVVTLSFDVANQAISTLNLKGTSCLKNLSVIGVKTRYAIHDDFGYADGRCQRLIENCIIQVTSAYFGTAYGSGVRSGAVWVFRNCIIRGIESSPLTLHSNIDFSVPAQITFEYCRFIGKDNVNISFGGMASTVVNKIKFVGCQFTGIAMKEEVASSGVGFDFEITGHGNTQGLYAVTVTDSGEYYTNFSDECDTLLAGATIAKGAPCARNGYYTDNIDARATYRFFGVAMSSGTLNNPIVVKRRGYINISDTALGTVNIGDRIGISAGAFVVVTSGDYIGICDLAGYFRLLDSVAKI